MFFKKEKKNYLVEFKWEYGFFKDKRTVQAKNKNEAISKVLKAYYNNCEIIKVEEVKF